MCGGLRALGKFSFVSPKLFQNEKLEKKKIACFLFPIFHFIQRTFSYILSQVCAFTWHVEVQFQVFFVLVLVFDQREDPP